MSLFEYLNMAVSNRIKRKKLSIGWILSGNENIGSSRIHCINLHKELKTNGIRSHILQAPGQWLEKLDLSRVKQFIIIFSKLDIVIFQRVYDAKALELCRKLKKAGTRCGFFMADIYKASIIHEVDFILTPSESLKTYLTNIGIDSEKIYVLPDAIETSPSMRKEYRAPKNLDNNKIKVVWVGIDGHWNTLDPIRKLLYKNDTFKHYELITISNHKMAKINWRLDTVWDEILTCDIAVVPVDMTNDKSLVKSNNRVTMFMALGLPIICSPIPSYQEIILHSENGFLACNDADWKKYLIQLGNADQRKLVGENSFQFAHKNFNKAKITSKLIWIIGDVILKYKSEKYKSFAS